MPKIKSAKDGRYTKAKGADPATTFKSDDYPTKQLRKLVKLWSKYKLHDAPTWITTDEFVAEANPLIASIKKRMGWK